MQSSARNIDVINLQDLHKAAAAAKPGDTIRMLPGRWWKNVQIVLNSVGTAAKPIVVMAADVDGVFIEGKSSLRIGGKWLVVSGLRFTNGSAGKDAVVSFRSDKNNLANNCRLTNCSIDNFNNQMRMEENYWIALYGKNNRVDHCNFSGKLNMGVLLAVLLDDERSRETNHSIDHNHFGPRIPLGSNGGEMIRVGVSQHATFNANVRITDNYFEHCDGETEIVSIKSGGNLIAGNLFFESQGSVVLRHGDNNTVKNNIFLGNGKNGTGGIRVINNGQWVVNNFLYGCTGSGFRAPLAIMNGVPNSPANRYVAAKDAVIAGNSFVNCAPLSFCEGSDAERSQIPENVFVLNNIIQNKDTAFRVMDLLSGFHFAGNVLSYETTPIPGFTQDDLASVPVLQATLPSTKIKGAKISDSLQKIALIRLGKKLPEQVGFADAALLSALVQQAQQQTGSRFKKMTFQPVSVTDFVANSMDQLVKALESSASRKRIILSGKNYLFTKPLMVLGEVSIMGGIKGTKLSSASPISAAFYIGAGSSLTLSRNNFDLSGLQAGSFISADTMGYSSHINLVVLKDHFTGLQNSFFKAAKTSIADSIVIRNSSFENGNGLLFDFTSETDKKGWYNVENLRIIDNRFTGHKGQLLNMLRGGNDESTMGPMVEMTGNEFVDCNSGEKPLIEFYGTQVTDINANRFENANKGGTLIRWTDIVKAKHRYANNTVLNSGELQGNMYCEIK